MTTIVRTNSENPDLLALTNKLDEELCRIYNTNAADFEEYNRITGLATVVLAYENGEPVACGCFKQTGETTIELKRMYVKPEFRGRGIASALVGELEKWAIESGNTVAILETGNRQPGAVAMYEKLGYSIIENSTPHEAGPNVCMQKKINLTSLKP